MFYVYAHCRPDGTPFYVGKGSGRRAHNFTARSKWHKNIVAKYGADNIIVEIQECNTEDEAFLRETLVISALRQKGVCLVNLTDGGEGSSGWNHSAETVEKIRKANSGCSNSTCGKARHSTPHTDKTKAAIKEKTIEQFSDDLNRLKHSLLTQAMWKDPAYVEKQLNSRSKRDYTSSAAHLKSTLKTKYRCSECGYINNAGNVHQHQRRKNHTGVDKVSAETSPAIEK